MCRLQKAGQDCIRWLMPVYFLIRFYQLYSLLILRQMDVDRTTLFFQMVKILRFVFIDDQSSYRLLMT